MTAPTPHDHAERVQGEVTAAVERAVDAWFDGDPHHNVGQVVASLLAAALNGPADDEGMDDLTMAIHIALCEDSPNECIEWRGPCVKAAEAARAALLGGAA